MVPRPSTLRPLHWLLLVVALLPATARAAVPVGLYPLQVEGLTDGERAEVQSIVESALRGAEARGVLEPRSPLVVPGNCKSPITVGCVATLAKGGVILYAKARRRGAQVNVTVLFVDATGRKTRAVAFPVDLFIQNLRPANDAIATVEADLVAGALEDPAPPPPPAALARPAPPERPPGAADAPPRTVAPEAEPQSPAVARTEPQPLPLPSAPIDLKPVPKPEPAARVPQRPEPRAVAAAPGDWRRGVGNWCTGGGVAMLVAGAAVGLTGMRLDDALQDRFDKGALRPDDARLYDRVDLYEKVANALFVAGGVATAAGLTFHAMAPAGGGAGVAVAGSF